MTTYTEPYLPCEALLSEGDGSISREVITIVSGAGVIEAGTVVGKITTGSSASAAAFAGNTGTGTVGSITVSAGAKPGAYKLVIVEPGSNVGTFTVEDPDGVLIGTGVVASAFSAGGLAFTVSDATDFIAGDGFTITVAAGSGKWDAYDDGNSNGTQVAAGVTLYTVDATSGDVTTTAIVRLAEVKKDALRWDDAVDSTARSTAYTQLAAINIIAR